jgi:vacuolar-type H+-ATPase subunit I/STV1
MSETNPGNEQAQASRPRGVRRKERSVQHQPDSDRTETPRSTGSGSGCESERTNRAVSERIGRFQSRGQIFGGILRQLLVKADNQLAKVETRLQQLEIERQTLEEEREQAQQEQEQLRSLLENLQKTIQDNS